MNELVEQIKTNAKSHPRHAIALVAIILSLVILPSINTLKLKAINGYTEKKSLLSWMQINKNTLIESNHGTRTGTDEVTISDLAKIAAEYEITLDRIQPKTDGGVLISTNDALYSKTIALIGALNTSSKSTKITSLTLNKGKQPGNVSATITIQTK
ncbi:MAG: hypothetical protein ACI90U_002669 [Pseudomonadales bacterium]|jgi:hypothetical protein